MSFVSANVPLQGRFPDPSYFFPTMPGASTTFIMSDASQNQISVRCEVAEEKQDPKPVPQIVPADDSVLHEQIHRLMEESSKQRAEITKLRQEVSLYKRKYEKLKEKSQQTFAVPIPAGSFMQFRAPSIASSVSSFKTAAPAPIGSSRAPSEASYKTARSDTSDRKRRRNGEAPSVSPSVASTAWSSVGSWVSRASGGQP